MYRDVASRPAEHDRAVTAILIAEALIAECATAVAQLRTERPERWGAARSLFDTYPEIWTQLDTARRLLARRGVNTIGYDELRQLVNPVLAVSHADGSHTIDGRALDDARRAVDELRLAIPGTDWRAVDARTRELPGTSVLRGGQWIAAAAAVLVLLALALVAWTSAIASQRKPGRAAILRDELSQVVTERRERIAAIESTVGDRCDPPLAHELMKLLVMDGRWQDARGYADRYQVRCGEDAIVQKWSKAPKPRSAR